MTNRHNALAELAKWMEVDIRTMEFGNIAQLKRMQKAKCIVAELAKCWQPKAESELVNDYVEAFANCRAIAEKGDEDGK